MCALCGVLGGAGHWTDAVARPGVFTRSSDPVQRRRERVQLVAGANHILRAYGLALRIVRNAALAEEVVADTFHQTWRDAARFDPARGNPLAWMLIMGVLLELLTRSSVTT